MTCFALSLLTFVLGFGLLVQQEKVHVSLGPSTIYVTAFLGAPDTFTEVKLDGSGLSFRSGTYICTR